MSIRCIASAAAPAAIGPYSPAVEAGGMVFVSGQLGIEPVTGAPESGVQLQTERAIRNINSLLAAAGLDLGHVVKTTIFLTNMSDFAVVNEVYASHFKKPYPARSTIQVTELPKNALVEIEAIAVK
jgi:2-iminobutanoate/2-iminopropanoate deaminase